VLKLDANDLKALTTDRTARDHRFQRALLDAARYHALKSAPLPQPTRQPLPPVQRSGISRGFRQTEGDFSTLNARLNQSGRMDDGVALLNAMRSKR
jgi:hypothetical protein